MAQLTKADIHRLFELLNEELAAADCVGELYLVGGAVMCLAFDARDSTKDVDTTSFRPSLAVLDAAQRVATREDVRDSWLNNAVAGYTSDHGTFAPFLNLSHLKVCCADAKYMLAMKCLAFRLGHGYQDLADIRYLLRNLAVSDLDEVQEILQQYYDLSGYPYTNWKKPLSLFGRIIAIADVYDAITSPRVYRKDIMSPDRALGHMLEGAGLDYDPILIKVFINMLGVYPVGTLLKLDTGELALVVRSSKKKNEKMPIVCLMEENVSGGYYNGETINLAERDSRTGNYVREVIDTYHPSDFGIQPVEHIFSST